jgi:UTP-glucose-1-phosphate uridylyltransferase
MQLCGWKNVKTGEQIISIPGKELFEFAFSGIAVFDVQVYREMRTEGKFSLLDVFLDLCKRETVKGFDHTGSRFIDVGKPGSREEAEKYFN